MGVHCCCLHINYIVYQHFDRLLHIGSSDPTCVQNFRPVPSTVCEILGFKLKKNNDNVNKKNWKNGPFAKVHCLQTFWQVAAHRVVGPHLGTKFQTCISWFLRYWDSN